MLQRLTCIWLALFVLSPSAQAEGGTVTQTGYVAAGLSVANDDPEQQIFGDFEFVYPVGSGAFVFGGLGRVGLRHETYISLRHRTAGGLVIDAGIVRPAFDDVAPGALLNLVPTSGQDAIATTHSLLTASTFSDSGFVPLGAKASSKTGDLALSGSIHRESRSDVYAASVAVGLDTGDLRVEGAFELSQIRGKAEQRAKLSVSRNFDAYSLRASYFQHSDKDLADIGEIFLKASLSDQISVMAMAHFDRPVHVSARAMGLSWSLSQTTDVRLGILSDGSGRHINALLAHRF